MTPEEKLQRIRLILEEWGTCSLAAEKINSLLRDDTGKTPKKEECSCLPAHPAGRGETIPGLRDPHCPEHSGKKKDSKEKWETIIDFTDIDPEGVPAKDILKALEAAEEDSTPSRKSKKGTKECTGCKGDGLSPEGGICGYCEGTGRWVGEKPTQKPSERIKDIAGLSKTASIPMADLKILPAILDYLDEQHG